MDFPKAYSKKLRLSRDLAREFVSVRQFLNSSPETDGLSNTQLQDLVVNKAYRYSLQHGIVGKLKRLCDNNRTNGATVQVNIATENWLDLVQTVGLAKRWNRLDEWDLFEEILRVYIDIIKTRRCLP